MIKQVALRLLALPLTLLIITAALYGIIMLAPPEERAQLYIPSRTPPLSQQEFQNLMNRLITEHGLDDPYPCLLYTSPSPRDRTRSRMPSSA